MDSNKRHSANVDIFLIIEGARAEVEYELAEAA